jgi:hypothetical protein
VRRIEVVGLVGLYYMSVLYVRVENRRHGTESACVGLNLGATLPSRREERRGS